jgi:hypothetical protein
MKGIIPLVPAKFLQMNTYMFAWTCHKKREVIIITALTIDFAIQQFWEYAGEDAEDVECTPQC